MMKKIFKDIEICHFDGVSATEVYYGGLTDMVKAQLTWRKVKDEEMGEVEILKLSEIVKQIPLDGLITVIVDGPLRGEILQYGNYGYEWYQIGETCGYA